MKDAQVETSLMRKIGQRIKVIRENTPLKGKKKMTQGDLARRTGVTTGFISQIEKGLSSTTPKMLAAIAKALNVPLFVLMAEEDISPEDLLMERDFFIAIKRKLPSVKYAHDIIKRELDESK